MANDPEMATLNRTLKEISHSLQKLSRATDAINSNLVEIFKRLTPLDVLQAENLATYTREATHGKTPE